MFSCVCCLWGLISLQEQPNSEAARRIAREVFMRARYPLLPFGLSTSAERALPLPARETPLSVPEKRALLIQLNPIMESMNAERVHAAKVGALILGYCGGLVGVPDGDPPPPLPGD
jgi:hypothetical protein